MAITLTATLLTASVPKPVQVVLNGMTTGQVYTVVGVGSDGSTWTIPGGTGTSTGAQVVLVDNRGAFNSTVTYRATVDGVVYTSGSVTISFAGVAAIQSIDGLNIASVNVGSVTEPRKGSVRSSVFSVAGRQNPAVRIDVAGSYEYAWIVDTTGADSATLQSILMSGVPIVRRLVSGIRDLPSVVLGLPTDWSDELFTHGTDSLRRWKITVRGIDEPQPTTPQIAYTWVDFDLVMGTRLWKYYNVFTTTTGWTATNGTLSQQTGGYNTTYFARVSATTAATAVSLYETAAGTTAVSGDVWTVTCRVKGTAGRTIQAGLTWSGGTNVLGTGMTATGAWQEVSVTATAPASTTGFKVGATMAATGVVNGTQLDVSSFTVSKGSTVPVGVFDEMFNYWTDFDTFDWGAYE